MAVSVYSKNLNIFNAEQFKESVSETSNTSLYFTIGKVTPWTDETVPLQGNTSVTTLYEVYRNMIGGKRVTGNDMYHCIRRHDWTEGTVYDQYDHCTCSLILFNDNVKFFVVTSNWDVYKCISNNNGAPSTVMPIQRNLTGTVTELDGYIWKYMYTVSSAEQIRFTTNEYIPVKTLLVDDNSLQWDVQTGAIDGAINHIEITNGGNNYSDNTQIWIQIVGDGTGANAFAKTNSVTHQISSIVVDKPGLGYTYATAIVYDDSTFGTGAVLRPIISPPGGHGSDPLRELGGSNLIVNVRLRYDEDGKLPTTNDFRQVAIIKDPLEFGSQKIKENTAFAQTLTLTLSGVGGNNFQQDELVYQGASLETATFVATVVSWNGSNQLKVSNPTGIVGSEIIVGTQSRATGIVSIPYTQPELKPYSGQLLYIDNVTPIPRAQEQIEDFKIVFKF